MEKRRNTSWLGFVKTYPLSLLETLVIWIACMMPIPETPLDDVPLMDKWTHFVMYGSLTFLIWMEHWWHKGRTGRQSGGTTIPAAPCPTLTPNGGMACRILLPMLMGGAIELAQAYLTTCRSGDWLDFVSNSIGVILGALLAALAIATLRRTRKG